MHWLPEARAAQRADAPLPQLVDALRAQRGQDWQPADATLGKGEPLAGAQTALTPAPVERDWKAWLLWALLVGGALIVAGFAFSLLKKPASKRFERLPVERRKPRMPSG